MSKVKRIISLMIVLCLALSLMSVSVFAATKFKDVSENQWHYKYITTVVDKGIMSGTSSDTFSPNSKVTRAQVAQTLYAMAGKPTVTKSSGFKDVAAGKWYTNAINWAASVGIVAGYYDGTYKPNEDVTRQQFVTILHAYARNVETTDKRTGFRSNIQYYEDFDMVAMFALESLEWAVAIDVISSVSTTSLRLDPRGTMTRAQLATMLCSYTNFYVKTHTLKTDKDHPGVCSIQTAYYQVDFPSGLQNDVLCEEFNDKDPVLAILGLQQNKRNGAGHVFTIALYPKGEDFTFLPNYDVYGYLTKGNEQFTVVIDYATDFQFDEDLADEYSLLWDFKDTIVSSIKGINGYTLVKN